MRRWTTIASVLLACSGCWRSGSVGPDAVDAGPDPDTGSGAGTDSDTIPGMNVAPGGYGPVTPICWVRTVSSGVRVDPTDLVAFPDGSAVAVGGYRGALVLGAGEPNETVLDQTGGQDVTDHFLARFGADGSLAWAVRIGVLSNGDARARAVERVADGGVVVTGSFEGEAVLGEGEPNEVTIQASGDDDLFLARYGADGRLAWARTGTMGAREKGTGLAVLADGSIFVSGAFDASGGTSVFLTRYAPDGSLVWTRAEAGTTTGREIAVAPDGSIVVSGVGSGELTFGAGEPEESTLAWTDPGGQIPQEYKEQGIVFWASFSGDGGLGWARGASTTFADPTGATAPLGLDDGSLAVVGTFIDALGFDMGGANETVLIAPSEETDNGFNLFPAMFLAAVGAGGEFLWARGTHAAPGSGAAASNGVALPGSRILVGGSMFGTVDLGGQWLRSSGAAEPFAAIYGAQGDLEWATRLGSGWSKEGGAAAMAGLADGTFLVVGAFGGLATFVDGQTDEPIEVQAKGEQDGFLLHVCP